MRLILLHKANNPIVWNLLEPILQLASRIITDAHVKGWYITFTCVISGWIADSANVDRWDALLFGDIKEVKPAAPPGNPVQYSFHLRPPATSHKQRNRVQRYFIDAAENIRLCFGHGGLSPKTSRLYESNIQWAGITFQSWNYTPRQERYQYLHVYITMDIRLFQGLLLGGLNVCICTRGPTT